MLAAVNVVELLLGDTVVDVDSLEEELALLCHLFESVDTGGGLLGQAHEVLANLGPEVVVTGLQVTLDDLEDDLEFLVGGGGGVGECSELLVLSLGLDTFVHHDGGITTVINEHIGTLVIGPAEHLEGTFPVFLKGLVLPGEDVGSLGGDDGGSGVVLGGVDVAGGPSDLGTEGSEGLDKGSGLDGHVEGAGNSGAFEDLFGSVLLTDVHEAGHLDFSNGKFLASPLGESDVFDFSFEVVNHFVRSFGVFV